MFRDHCPWSGAWLPFSSYPSLSPPLDSRRKRMATVLLDIFTKFFYEISYVYLVDSTRSVVRLVPNLSSLLVPRNFLSVVWLLTSIYSRTRHDVSYLALVTSGLDMPASSEGAPHIAFDSSLPVHSLPTRAPPQPPPSAPHVSPQGRSSSSCPRTCPFPPSLRPSSITRSLSRFRVYDLLKYSTPTSLRVSKHREIRRTS